jgi:hypothetical protein
VKLSIQDLSNISKEELKMLSSPSQKNGSLSENTPSLSCLSPFSIGQSNRRVIEKEAVIFNHLSGFSQQILGPTLAESLHWQPLLAIKTKYLFSKELHQHWLQLCQQVEWRFYQIPRKALSISDRILISCMRALASWDMNVSTLVVNASLACLEPNVRTIFLQCLNELSVRASIVIIATTTGDEQSAVGIHSTKLCH